MISRRAFVLGALAPVVLAGCSDDRPVTTLPSGGAAPAGADPAAVAMPTAVYTLGSGDRVKVVTFRHDDLSGEFQLDGNGNFALPLVGEINASGSTARELEQRIIAKLKDGFLVDPQVSVEVTNYRPFYILGEVTRPGSYPYVNGMTAIEAVTIAGGFTYRAKQNAFLMKRGGANSKGVLVPPTQPILPGDIVEVEERFF